jgi:hypothetical protein
MNRWRVGEDRGSKETDGCPLTGCDGLKLWDTGQTTRFALLLSAQMVKFMVQSAVCSGFAVWMIIVRFWCLGQHWVM